MSEEGALPKRLFVVLKRPTAVRNVGTWAAAIVDAIGNNPAMFPSPSPALTKVKTDVSTFDAAQVSATTRARGTVAARNAALKVLLADMDGLKHYVQSVADADLQAAPQVIANALMRARTPRSSGKAPLAVRAGKPSGYVLVIALAAKNAAHEWACSLDDGATWTSLPTSLQAKITAGPFTPGARALFRHRVVTKAGPGQWGDPVSIIVT